LCQILENNFMHLNLETNRLIIRPISIDDNGFIWKLVNTEGWLKYIGDRNVNNDQDAKIYIQKILDREGEGWYYGVFENKHTKIAMGIVTFLQRETQAYPDLGFATLPEFEGFGYTLEASQAFLDNLLSDHHDLSKIIAITKSDNLRSINLIKKLGFEFFDTDAMDHQLSIYMISKKNQK
jgi:ribosomal-protein-alanine N-acetyltransferase